MDGGTVTKSGVSENGKWMRKGNMMKAFARFWATNDRVYIGDKVVVFGISKGEEGLDGASSDIVERVAIPKVVDEVGME